MLYLLPMSKCRNAKIVANGNVKKDTGINVGRENAKAVKDIAITKMKLLPALMALLMLAYYGSLANAGELVNVSADEPSRAWIVAVHTPHTGLAERVEVKTQVLAMLAEEGIDTIKAERIIQCESSWRPTATHYNKDGSNDAGLWQINSVHGLSVEDRMDVEKSTKFAIKLIKRNGWRDWVCNGL